MKIREMLTIVKSLWRVLTPIWAVQWYIEGQVFFIKKNQIQYRCAEGGGNPCNFSYKENPGDVNDSKAPRRVLFPLCSASVRIWTVFTWTSERMLSMRGRRKRFHCILSIHGTNITLGWDTRNRYLRLGKEDGRQGTKK